MFAVKSNSIHLQNNNYRQVNQFYFNFQLIQKFILRILKIIYSEHIIYFESVCYSICMEILFFLYFYTLLKMKLRDIWLRLFSFKIPSKLFYY